MYKKTLLVMLALISSSCGSSNTNAQDCIALPESLVDFLNTKITINSSPGYLLSSMATMVSTDPDVYLIAGELSFSKANSREYSIAIWEINGLENFDSIVSISSNAKDYSEFPSNVEKLFYTYSPNGSSDLVKNCLFSTW